MRYLCGYCKFHECGKGSDRDDACICVAKHLEIEHWYVACKYQFKDRRESVMSWTGQERRKTARLMATA